jgi:hypothetical protein
MHWIFRLVAVLASASLLLAASAVAFAQNGDATVSLSSEGGSGVTATASLTAVGNQTSISITAAGLPANTSHAWAIGNGTCANRQGDAFDFFDLTSGAGGTASATDTAAATLASLQDGNHNVHIHTNLSANSTVVACGNIPAAAVATATQVAAATATPAAVASATAVSTASATAVAAATATAVSLPVTGDPGLPILPLILIGAGAIGSGLFLGRSRSQRR